MKPHLRQGQQLVEYLLLFTIVLIVLIAFIRPYGFLHETVNEAISRTVDRINLEADKIR